MAEGLKLTLLRALHALESLSIDQLLATRQSRIMQCGRFAVKA
jgi:hypothetical protein